MHRSGRRLLLVAVLLAVALTPAAASQKAPPGAPPALAALASPSESLARLWSWVTSLLPGHRPDVAPAVTRPAPARSGPGVRPSEGSAPDPYG
jgi:hypothetical protein